MNGAGPIDIQLVVTDLDGTLWDVELSLHERTRTAISRLEAVGVPVLVATGRRVRSTRAPLERLGLRPPAVVLNGSLGLDLATDDRFHQGGFTADDAVLVLATFRSHGVEPCVYVDHHDYAVWVSSEPSTHPEHLASFGADVRTGDLAHVVQTETILGFGVLGIPESTAVAVGAALAPLASPHVDRDRHYGNYAITAAPTSQSKWDGVAAYCERHGLDETRVLAIGDGPNDVELLRQAAIAVVPEDGHPSARAHAHHVVGRARDGGWADLVDIIGV